MTYVATTRKHSRLYRNAYRTCYQYGEKQCVLQQVNVSDVIVPMNQMPDQMPDHGPDAGESAEKRALDDRKPVNEHHSGLKGNKAGDTAQLSPAFRLEKYGKSDKNEVITDRQTDRLT